jgi:hypothetical protein
MIYKLNNVPISSYGAYPVLSSEKLALSGIFDCPKRKSPTERNWGTSIEPWVDEQDIILEGIEMSMDIAIPTASINLLKDEVLACTELDIDDENRNYLLNTSNFENINHWETFGENPSGPGSIALVSGKKCLYASRTNCNSNSYQLFMQHLLSGLAPNTFYTLSFVYKNIGRTGNIYIYSAATTNIQRFDLPVSSSFEKKSVTFNTGSGDAIERIRFDCLGVGLGLQSDLWIYDIKLEKGEFKTDYMPAPEDQYFNQQVICKSECQVVEKKAYSILSARFWKELPTLPELVLIASNSGDIRIDGFNLYKDFSVVEAKHSDLYSIPKRIDIGTTEPYPVVEYRESKELSFDLFMKGDSFYDLYFKMQQFQSLLLGPGMRSLYYYGKSFSCYFKAGFKASYVAKNVLKFTLKLSTND